MNILLNILLTVLGIIAVGAGVFFSFVIGLFGAIFTSGRKANETAVVYYSLLGLMDMIIGTFLILTAMWSGLWIHIGLSATFATLGVNIATLSYIENTAHKRLSLALLSASLGLFLYIFLRYT